MSTPSLAKLLFVALTMAFGSLGPAPAQTSEIAFDHYHSVEEIEVPGFGECLTYMATASFIDDDLRPYSWYKALVLAGCERLRLPTDYIAMIQGITSIEDPDRARHANNMKIVEQTRISANTVSV